jgi:hypothetical protein
MQQACMDQMGGMAGMQGMGQQMGGKPGAMPMGSAPTTDGKAPMAGMNCAEMMKDHHGAMSAPNAAPLAK